MFGWLRGILGGERDDMAKKSEPRVVQYSLLDDGVSPGKAPYGAVLRLPLDLELVPNQPQMINLGVSFDTAVLVFPTKTFSDDAGIHVRFAGCVEGRLLLPDSPAIVVLEAKGKDHYHLEAKTAVGMAVFLLPPDELRKNG